MTRGSLRPSLAKYWSTRLRSMEAWHPHGIVGGGVVVGWAPKDLPADLLLVDLVGVMVQHAPADVDEHLPKAGGFCEIGARGYLDH